MPLRTVNHLLEKLNKELEAVEEENILKRTEQSVILCQSHILKAKELMLSKPFTNETDEIHFFKNIKPNFISLLIYNVQLFNLEYRRPRKQQEIEKEYLLLQLSRVNDFIEQNIEFYKYYKTGATHSDSRYFVRGVKDIHILLDTRIYNVDEDFNTAHSHLLAFFKAYDMLSEYIQSELSKIDGLNNSNNLSSKKKLPWTESKVAMVELMYALEAAKSINSGNVEIMEIKNALESVFEVDLDGFYKTYAEIRMRKINRTKFIDHLRNSLVNRMEKDDDKYYGES